MKKAILAMLACMAISLIGVATVSAAQFTSESTSTKLEGTQVIVVTEFDAFKFSCNSLTFVGEAAGGNFESFELAPTYTGPCKGFYGTAPTPNGCKYKFYANGAVDLACPAGKDFMIDTSFNGCNITIPPQAGLKAVSSTTDTWNPEAGIEKHRLLMHLNISGIEYTENGGFLCSYPEPTTKSNGSIGGDIEVNARDAGTNAPIGITVDP